MTATPPTTVRLDAQDRQRIAALAVRYGKLSVSGVIRLALLRLAEAEGVEGGERRELGKVRAR